MPIHCSVKNQIDKSQIKYKILLLNTLTLVLYRNCIIICYLKRKKEYLRMHCFRTLYLNLKLVAVAVLFLAISLASPILFAEEGFCKVRNMAYGDHSAQRLDIYHSKKTKDAPVMIYIHGGGWRRGDKGRVGEKAIFFNSKGWIFVSTNYRLLPEGRHPNNVDDVAKAIAWTNDNIKKYGGDPEKIFIMGHSAGAHLAALVAIDEKPLKKCGKDLNIIKGVIPLDTQGYDVSAQVAASRTPLYAEVFGTVNAQQRDASPVHHLAMNKNIPPFLIAYSSGMGRRRNTTRSAAANRFAEALKRIDVHAEVIDASDRNHREINVWFGSKKDHKVTGAVVRFLDRILGGKIPIHTKSIGSRVAPETEGEW